MPSMKIKLDVDQSGFDSLIGVVDDVIHLKGEGYLELGTLRHGMESGKDSVALCFKLPDGRAVIAETSAELYVASARAVTAWQEGRRERGES
jgi:hypothetical protein